MRRRHCIEPVRVSSPKAKVYFTLQNYFEINGEQKREREHPRELGFVNQKVPLVMVLTLLSLSIGCSIP